MQQLVDTRQYGTARKLLDDDAELIKFAHSGAHSCLNALNELKSAADVVSAVQNVLRSHNGSADNTWSELYMLAISNKLSESDSLKDMLATLRRLNSSVLQECLKFLLQEESVRDSPDLSIADTASDLRELLAKIEDHQVLRSAHDIQVLNIRTTVIAQKVELGRSSAKTTAEETSYTNIVDRFVSKVELFLGSRLFNPQDTFLHEIFLYDIKKLHREVFTPRPRFAIERALNSPHDYLSCACCNSELGGLSASHPATAILYQLYLESGSVINIADLWNAFWTIIASEDSKHDDVERTKVLALFSKALAELKYLGVIKNSRKKVDHLAKLVWQGL